MELTIQPIQPIDTITKDEIMSITSEARELLAITTGEESGRLVAKFMFREASFLGSNSAHTDGRRAGALELIHITNPLVGFDFMVDSPAERAAEREFERIWLQTAMFAFANS